MLTVAHGDGGTGEAGGEAATRSLIDEIVASPARRRGRATRSTPARVRTRLGYQSGCRRPPDATISQAPWASANHATGDWRGCPLWRPAVCGIRTSMPRNLPRPRRMLRFIRAFMRCRAHRDGAPGEPLLRPPRLPAGPVPLATSSQSVRLRLLLPIPAMGWVLGPGAFDIGEPLFSQARTRSSCR
jgi:hypothetical protein